MLNLIKQYKNDLSAGIVVFFVALPLCLGIALASGAPLFSGIIAGIVGGIVIGLASKSPVGVSGPAAGLVVIVLTAIDQLGSWEALLLAIFLAGILQVLMGFARLGVIAYYFPSSVIKGMLTGIGVLIILKQIPYALGFIQDAAAENTGLMDSLNNVTPGAIVITSISLCILLLWEIVLNKKHKIFQVLQGPLVVVIMGIVINYLYRTGALPFQIQPEQLVQLPVTSGISGFIGQFKTPDFSALTNYHVYVTAATIAIVASLETLLCVEATDKLDPERRITPTNRELKAQGLGNMISGLIGGLPLTQVIVRSSANISFGGKTKVSAIFHGVLLLVCAFFIPAILNMIPLASLACILLVVGYKLAKPSIFKDVYKLGWSQFIPFIATVIGVVGTDLLKGIGIGLVFAVLYILKNNYRNAFYMENAPNVVQGHEYNIVLAEEVSFLNKAHFLKTLNEIPENSRVTVDGTRSKVIDYDIVDILEDFRTNAQTKNITLDVTGMGREKLV